MTTHRLGTAENGSTISVDLGDAVVVSLPENPTTGYRWTVTADGTALKLDGEPGFERAGDGVGAGGTRVFRFVAVHAGRGSLSGWLTRPGGDRSVAAPDFHVQIVAQA